MNKYVIRKIRKAVSWITIFALLFSVFSPLNNLVFATIDTTWNSITWWNGGYINIVNSGSYSVDFAFSGTLDAWDIVYLDVIDWSWNTITWSTVATWSETGVTISWIDVSTLMDWNIVLSWSVFNSWLTEVASGITGSATKNTFDYESLFTSIWWMLTASWIVNNLSWVTNSNVTSFSWLYFEKTWYWKILFNSWMDLTNSWTQTFLQNLPTKLDMSDWYIDFDPTSTDFENYWAQLIMNFATWSTFVTGINDPSYFVVRSQTWELIDSSSVLSWIVWACEVWWPCTVVFDTAHFTNFDLKPILTNVTVSSNNAYSWSLAKIWDVVTLSFSWSEALTWVIVSFSWTPAASIVWWWDSWTAISEPISSWDSNWVVNFTIDYSDMNSNTWTTATWTTDSTQIAIEKTLPTASVEYSTTWATNWDVTATLTWASEPIVITNNWWLDTYTFTWNTSFVFQFRDEAGNTGSTTATVTWIDKNLPTITLNWSWTINIEYGDDYTELWATWSDTTDWTWVVSDIIWTVNTWSIWTYPIEYRYVNSLWSTWSTTRTVIVADTIIPTASVEYSPATLTWWNVEATLTWASESITWTLTHTFTTNWTYNFVFHDLQWNTGSTLATVTWIDKTWPVISSKSTSNLSQTWVTLNFNFTDSNFSTWTWYVLVYTWADVNNLVETWATTINFASWTWNWSSIFDNLESSTDYDYLVSLTDNVWNTTTSTWVFSTPTLVTLTWGTLTETWATALTWTTLTSWSTLDLSWSILTIESDSNDDNYITWSLTISWANIVVASGSWNGILIPPTVVDNSSSDAATWSEIWNWITVIQSIKVWAENSSLTATWGWYFNVSFVIPGYSSGTVFDLYRSNNWTTWEAVYPDSTCTLDTGWNCSFRTDHLTVFAPVLDTTPDSFSFTNVTWADLSTDYTTTTTVAWINTGSTISISWAWTYKINSGSYTWATWTVSNWDVVTIKVTSSSSNSTSTSTTLTIGWVSAAYSVTTKAASGGSSSGGGGSATKDYCPAWDKSASYYDWICWYAWENNPNNTWTWTWTWANNTPGNSWVIKISFKDIDSSFAIDYINYLASKWIIKWFADGTFKPNNNTTRAEFLKMVLNSAWINVWTWTQTPFTDIPKDWTWMIPYVIKAKELWIISGQNLNGKLIFRPNGKITRAEAIKILLIANKIDVSKLELTENQKMQFVDITDSWMIPYVIKAQELWIISGQVINGKLKFRPNDWITRAESSKVIVKVLLIKK